MGGRVSNEEARGVPAPGTQGLGERGTAWPKAGPFPTRRRHLQRRAASALSLIR